MTGGFRRLDPLHHLTGRHPGNRPNPQWIIADTWVPEDQRHWLGEPLGIAAEQQHLEEDLRNGYDSVATQDGLVLLHRRT
ncbi:hypothetical protein [Streptomyces canus]|uniref:hypothetical protein n=1 Tax=Streptomyces canus TaxID=58343 RepID=UPI0036ECE21D